ncbi:MAG TPA: hypothetical protein VIO11_10750 [Candidatus Methanoperedens sp.]
MDIFDVLKEILKRKKEFMLEGMNENRALIKAQLHVSKDFHIPLPDIKILAG